MSSLGAVSWAEHGGMEESGAVVLEALGAGADSAQAMLREQGWAGGAVWAAQPWLLCQDQRLEVQGQQVLSRGD